VGFIAPATDVAQITSIAPAAAPEIGGFLARMLQLEVVRGDVNQLTAFEAEEMAHRAAIVQDPLKDELGAVCAHKAVGKYEIGRHPTSQVGFARKKYPTRSGIVNEFSGASITRK
jgi:hypothetical protein